MRLHIVAVGLMTIGCSTPYGARGWLGGYDDYRAGANGAVMVTFDGNGYTSSSEVTRMWHRRAAEVCGGPERYEVLDARRTADVSEVGQYTSSTQVTYSGNQAYATTTTNAPTQVTKHKVEGLIRCVNGGTYNPNRQIAEQ